MADIEFFATPGYGEMFLKSRHYSQAVRIGDRVEISGQGGWDDELNFPESLEAEIVQAFDNVERTLASAGVGWRDVVAVHSYHVADEANTINEAHNPIMVEQFRKRMGERAPIWTETGVKELALPTMHIEIRVVAVVAEEAS